MTLYFGFRSIITLNVKVLVSSHLKYHRQYRPESPRPLDTTATAETAQKAPGRSAPAGHAALLVATLLRCLRSRGSPRLARLRFARLAVSFATLTGTTRPLSFPPCRLAGSAHPCRLAGSAHPCRLAGSARPCRLVGSAHPDAPGDSHTLPSRFARTNRPNTSLRSGWACARHRNRTGVPTPTARSRDPRGPRVRRH